MPSKRLVVLDELDYQNLIDKSKRQEDPPPPANTSLETTEAHSPSGSESKPSETNQPPPEKPKERTPEPKEPEPKEPTPEPEVEEPEPKDPTPEPVEPPVEDPKSGLQEVIEQLSPTIQQPALRLLQRLSKLEGFGYDDGAVILDGQPVDNYSLKRFLVATCIKGAPNDLPLRLRLFLRKNKILKFRNPKITLNPKRPWRSFRG